MIKPLPLEADWVVWPKMLVLWEEQLMDTVEFTVEAYTSAGCILVLPSTFSICTAVAVRSLSLMVVLPPEVLPPASAAPP